MTRLDQGGAAAIRPSARELADAMREGLDRRRFCAPAPAGPDFAPLAQLEPRGRVLPYADLVGLAPTARCRVGARLVGWVRRALRAFLRPWLDLQTRFNEGVAETLLAHHAEMLRCLNDVGGQGRRIGELFHHFYQEQEARQLLAGRLDRLAGEAADTPGPAAEASDHVLEHVFIHTRLPAPPAQLLELSCGPAARAVELTSLGYQVTGVALDALPPAPGGGPADLPFPDESFDVVTALSGLTGVAPPAGVHAVAEAARVLRPGGRLLLTLPHDRARLEALLRPVAVVELTFGVRRGGRWAFTADEPAPGPRGAALALVVAEKT
ncbi:MAG TPA: class I SAM-dependent methyltransferase [Gemmataceae bacterium]|nr:class I SAM-dependent methyltransferase [Gemmataceae bacterium]